MILHISSTQPGLGKNREALAWAKEAAAMMNQAVSLARPGEVFAELFGMHGRIRMIVGY